MKKLPFLKPYFELLKIITFAIHYLPNIQRAGLFPLFNKSIQNNYIDKQYCRTIPKVFPPLPIRRTTTLNVTINFKELLDCFKYNNYEELKIKEYVRQKIKNSLCNEDKDIFKLFSDEKMKIHEIEKYFKEHLFTIPKLYFIEEYTKLYDILKEEKNEVLKPKHPKEHILEV